MSVKTEDLYAAVQLMQILSKLIGQGVKGELTEEEFRAQMANISDRVKAANDAWDGVDEA